MIGRAGTEIILHLEKNIGLKWDMFEIAKRPSVQFVPKIQFFPKVRIFSTLEMCDMKNV